MRKKSPAPEKKKCDLGPGLGEIRLTEGPCGKDAQPRLEPVDMDAGGKERGSAAGKTRGAPIRERREKGETRHLLTERTGGRSI